ncbi:MAG: YbhB/YbcL family Raf kinase inhibitor-like protein [Prochlorococcaceae cyanobacterium]
MRLESPAFREGEWIPLIHTGEGRDLSPALSWSGAPEGIRSYVLILEDPDAPAGLWVHWVLFDIPAEVHELPAGLPRSPTLENGSRHGSCWGVTTFSRVGYHGPMPPPGPPHRYRFTLWALDRELALPAGATAAEVRSAMEKHALAETVLTGIYGLAQHR